MTLTEYVSNVPSQPLPHICLISSPSGRVYNVCLSICWPPRTPVMFVLVVLSLCFWTSLILPRQLCFSGMTSHIAEPQPKNGHFSLKRDFRTFFTVLPEGDKKVNVSYSLLVSYNRNLTAYNVKQLIFQLHNLQTLQETSAGRYREKGDSLCILKGKI